MVSGTRLRKRDGGNPRILLGVTSDVSLALMRGFPEYLASQGWDVHVASAPGERLSALTGTAGISTHEVFMVREPSPAQDLLSLLGWIRLVRRISPDVISVGTPKAGLLGGISGALFRVPSRVYLLRGLRLETTAGPKRRVLKFLERVAMASAHDVISVSESLRHQVVEMGLVSPAKIAVIGAGSSNGVDIDAVGQAALDPIALDTLRHTLGLEQRVPVIGFVGRLTQDKGLDVLAEAREKLDARGVDHQLLVVGSIDDASAESGIARLGMSGRPPILTGQVPDPTPYYQLMDLLCLPTLREGFPNVVLEAGASGLPTVTTNATGAVDSVVAGVTGLIARLGQPESLADQLQVLLNDEQLRASMGKSARAHVTERFSRDDVWRGAESFYRAKLMRSVSARSRRSA